MMSLKESKKKKKREKKHTMKNSIKPSERLRFLFLFSVFIAIAASGRSLQRPQIHTHQNHSKCPTSIFSLFKAYSQMRIWKKKKCLMNKRIMFLKGM